MKYFVCVRETLEQVIPMEAPNKERACQIVRQGYDKGEIVLEPMDYIGVEFVVCEVEQRRKKTGLEALFDED